MARSNCSALAADLALLCGHRGGGDGCAYVDKEICVRDSDVGRSDFEITNPFDAQFTEVFVYDEDAERRVFTAVNYPKAGRVKIAFSSPPRVGQRFLVRIINHGNEVESSAEVQERVTE